MSLGKKKMLSQGAAGGVVGTDNFAPVLYTGNGGTQAITGVGFQRDVVWIKSRNASCDHSLTDSVRGVQELLSSNTTAAEVNQSPNGLTSFDSNGFTVTDVSSGGASVNGAAGGSCSGTPPNYVAYCWYAPTSESISASGSQVASTVKKNVDAGFSIVKYVGTGVSATVGHGLSSAPELIIAKNLDTAGGSGTYDGWPVYVSAIGNDHLLTLNSTAPKDSTGGTWDSTTPTSTVFSVKDNADNNKSGDNIIAY